MVGDDAENSKEDEKRDEVRVEEKWDPLQHGDPLDLGSNEDLQASNTMAVKDADSILDSNGRLLFPDSKHPSMASRRASHLRLDIKPPSPQPWDLVDPPADNVCTSGPEYYSTLESRKYDTLRSTSHTRPLIPKSSYYFAAPPPDSAYGTHPIGQIGLHHPREILRIERDYTGGELIQFAPIYPLELEGRITPTQFLESINAINEVLISAHSLRHSFLDNILAVFSLQLSRLFIPSHYEKEMQCLRYLVDDLNTGLYNPVGLNILWPQSVAFLYLEMEYY
ncbi:Golgin subfamily A member 7/ERF4 family-domain-containing protein [Infundibulicybe gibba]|nr:Golgin subfamily A member 7/ERF4 family-domain-containing protein [Infundibulicybe gibba]